jgi:hypothetical protein
VLVAVTTKFAQLQPGGGVPTVFHCGVAGYTIRAFGRVSATLGAFQGDDDTNALFGCHTLLQTQHGNKINTVYNYLTIDPRSASIRLALWRFWILRLKSRGEWRSMCFSQDRILDFGLQFVTTG